MEAREPPGSESDFMADQSGCGAKPALYWNMNYSSVVAPTSGADFEGKFQEPLKFAVSKSPPIGILISS